MREIDELYADSGEPVKESHGVSRGTALKVGGLGLAGALAAFMPGRAGAAVKKAASNATCSNGFNCFGPYSAQKCGVDQCSPDDACYCFTVAWKLQKVGQPNGACGSNFYCDSLGSCHYEGDGSCPPGTFCSKLTCCGTPQCVPYCGFACDFFDKPTSGSTRTGIRK